MKTSNSNREGHDRPKIRVKVQRKSGSPILLSSADESGTEGYLPRPSSKFSKKAPVQFQSNYHSDEVKEESEEDSETSQGTDMSLKLETLRDMKVFVLDDHEGPSLRPSVEVDDRDHHHQTRVRPSLDNDDKRHSGDRNRLALPDTPENNSKLSFGSDMTSVYRSGAERSVSPQQSRGPGHPPADRWGHANDRGIIDIPDLRSTSPIITSPNRTPSSYYRDTEPRSSSRLEHNHPPGKAKRTDTSQREPSNFLSKPVSDALEERSAVSGASFTSKSPSLTDGNDSNYSYGASSTRSTLSTHSLPFMPSSAIQRRDQLYSPVRPYPPTSKKSKPPRLRKRRKRSREPRGFEDPYKFLTIGTPLQKYCRRKDPHWRHFEVNQDLEYIQWYSPSKATKKTRIQLSNIVEIIPGQNSPGFRKDPRPRVKHQSFSIMYSGGKKYLDLICMNIRDHKMWVSSMNHLLRNIREGKRWAKMPKIEIREPQEKSKNTVYTENGATLKRYKDDLKKARSVIRHLLKSTEDLIKDAAVEIMRRRLKKLDVDVTRWWQETEQNQFVLKKQSDALRESRVILRVLGHKVDCLLKEQKAKGGLINNLLRRSTTPQLEPFSLPRTYTEPARRKSVLGGASNTLITRNRPMLPPATKRAVSDGRPRVGRARAKSEGEPLPWKPHKERSPRRGTNRKKSSSPRSSKPFHSTTPPNPTPPEWYRVLPREQKLQLRKMMVKDVYKGKLTEETKSLVCTSFRVTIKQADALGRYLILKYSTGGFRMLLH